MSSFNRALYLQSVSIISLDSTYSFELPLTLTILKEVQSQKISYIVPHDSEARVIQMLRYCA